MRSVVILLIEAKQAQLAEDIKGKGCGRPWETTLSTSVLKAVRPDELIRHTQQAGMDDLELQQVLESVQPWVPSGILTEDDFIISTNCSVCHMFKMTAPWVWQKSIGCSADSSAQMLLEHTIICEECYACVVHDSGMYVNSGWWRFVAADC